jgi:sterol desaturase/sphingolipid hydroxylase (fatty acid hydroxylase superfamily)
VFGVANLVAIAVFTLLIAVELAWGRARGRLGYTLPGAATNLAIGLGSVLVGTLTVLQGFAVHRYLDRHAPFTLDVHSVPAWIAITVLVDLAFYASHRAMHRVNLLWTVHAVHHQSEEMNLLVALRIGWFSVCASWLFYLPLAFLGVTLEMTLVARGASSLYQFWLHTQHIGRLGPLEWIFVTPSHHRVHHATNGGYIDKNYGGIFIVWDRLFGTFAEEHEAPIYGTTRPLRSGNPFWANAVEWVRLVQVSLSAPRAWDKVQLWFRPPEWQPLNARSGRPRPDRRAGR